LLPERDKSGNIELTLGIQGIVVDPESWAAVQQRTEVAQGAKTLGAAVCSAPELRQRLAELEALVQMASHLFSNALHELRSPLVAVRGYARLILEEKAGPITGAQREFLEIVLKNANRLVGLLNDLTRAASGQQLRIEALDIRSLWQESVELLHLHARKKSIKVIRQSSSGPFTVMGDREKLLLVLYKLLSNAIEVASDGAEIRAEFLRNEDLISVRISDSGAGMPSGIVKHLLGTEDGLSRDDGGFSPVNDIVWLHGGRMSAASAPGQGYVLTLMLPVIQPEDLEKEQQVV
jgi:signal transduction histidine kinase